MVENNYKGDTMVYQYRIFVDHGYDGVDWEVIFSNKKFTKAELQEIVNKAEEDPTREKDYCQGTCGSIAEHIMKNHKDFFDIEFITGVNVGDKVIKMELFDTKITDFDDIVDAITEELSCNDYHDDDGCEPTIKTIEDIHDFVECHASLNDEEWKIFQQILNENENFDGIDLIDEGPGGGAFSSEADYWRYRMDPNY
jgi:hypothetical protein